MIPVVRALASGTPPPWRVHRNVSTNPGGSAFAPITGWDVTAGYENGATTNGLVVPEAATVNVRIVYSRVNTASNTWALRPMRNGAELAAYTTFNGGKTATVTVSNVAVDGGDVLGVDLQTLFTNASAAAEAINTYIEVTAA